MLEQLFGLTIFPAGLFVLVCGVAYRWLDRKLVARLQNRVGPRWFQAAADIMKLLAKEEIIPEQVDARLFVALPIVALAGALTAMLYLPIAGLPPQYSFPGDLIVAVYLLSMLTLCTGLAGANSKGRFSTIGATRALTQMFSYEAPFLLALLGPAFVAGSWQINQIMAFTSHEWLIFSQPIGFIVAIIGLIGKLEMAPFDSPEAETEIVAGAITEYSGRGLALFYLGREVELVGGLTLIAAFYLGGVGNPLEFVLKTLFLLLGVAGIESLMPRLRIDQTVGLWWRFGAMLALAQWLVLLWRGVAL
jgi:NADH-quinone oxidoreductase subunit H